MVTHQGPSKLRVFNRPIDRITWRWRPDKQQTLCSLGLRHRQIMADHIARLAVPCSDVYCAARSRLRAEQEYYPRRAKPATPFSYLMHIATGEAMSQRQSHLSSGLQYSII